MPEDDMGVGHALKDPDGKSITEETFKKQAEKNKQSLPEIKQAVLEQLEGRSKQTILSDHLLKAAATSQGMSLEETKKETIKLLKKELHS